MKIAATLYDGVDSRRADMLIAEVAGRLRSRGLRLAGAVQSNPTVANRDRCDILLEDLGTGRVIKASQDRGSMARGCRLDSRALEESAGLAVSSIGSATDFVIINRYGRQESEGRGFRAAIEQAVILNVPVLVGLNRAHIDSWCKFVGDDPRLLPLDIEAVADWCIAQTAQPDAACASGEGGARSA